MKLFVHWVCLLALPYAASTSQASESEIRHLSYEGYEVWLDCDRRGPILFHYTASADTGDFPRERGYRKDPAIDSTCQSFSDDTFQSVLDDNQPKYDVGHQVPANHFDHSEAAIWTTNHWTNLLPQTASMNRGAWLRTEEIIECLRDQVDLEVWGGPIWGANTEDDYFLDSHGIETPSAFWKVIIRADNNLGIAWVIPNASAPKSSLDKWVTTIELVERITGLDFKASNEDETPTASWSIPSGCDFS